MFSVTFDLDTEKPVNLSQVGDFHMLLDASFNLMDQLSRCGHDGTIVHMHDDNGELIPMLPVKYCLINFTLLEAQQVDEDLDELLVPTMTTLLQAVDGVQEMTNLIDGSRCMVSRRLTHEDDFIGLECTIEKGTFDINLVDLKVENGGHGKDCADGSKLGDGSIGVKVVNARNL